MLSLPARPKDAAAPLVRAAGATETQRGRVDIDDDLDPRWRRLFLLGMSVMTEGPKALVGSALRTVPCRAFCGAVVTLLVQSSSATTMTIGLVSAGLLTFLLGVGSCLPPTSGPLGRAGS